MAGEEDLLRVAAEVLAVLVQDVALAGEIRRCAPQEVPVLGKPGCSAERTPLTTTADADRRMGALDRLGLVAGIGELVVLALEGRRLVLEEPDDNFAGLLEAVATLARRAQLDAVGPRLLLVPPGPDPELQTSPRNDVEGGRHFGEDRGVAIMDAGHQSPHAQALRRLGQRRQGDPALHAGAGAVGKDRVEMVEGPAATVLDH